MNTLDPMVSALIALCKAEGGEKFVADKAVVSAENLAQITKGVKLPSGNPRGVGPGLRAKISKAYPNWLATGKSEAENTSNHAQVHVKQASVAINGIATIEQSLEVLARHLSSLDAAMRPAAGALLMALAQQPDNTNALASLTVLLAPAAFTQQDRRAA